MIYLLKWQHQVAFIIFWLVICWISSYINHVQWLCQLWSVCVFFLNVKSIVFVFFLFFGKTIILSDIQSLDLSAVVNGSKKEDISFCIILQIHMNTSQINDGLGLLIVILL